MPHPNKPVAVRHPEAPGVMEVLDPAINYADDDIFVETYPQFFEEVENGRAIVESVEVPVVEQATANPGEKSRARRAK